MSRAAYCPTCGQPCRIAHLAKVDVFVCPQGHRAEQQRLFAGASQGLQAELFGPAPAPIATTPVQRPLFDSANFTFAPADGLTFDGD